MPIGKLAVRLRVAGADADQPLDLRGSCGFPLLPRLQLLLPTEVAMENTTADAAAGGIESDSGSPLPLGIAAVVWQDPLNVTFAVGTLTATLPPFSDGWVREASATDSPACVYGCDSSYRVRVASYDGAQTLVLVRVVQVSLQHVLLYVSYRYYQRDAITTESEVLYVPVMVPWMEPAIPDGSTTAVERGGVNVVADPRVTAWGLRLLGDAGGSRRVDEQPAVTWTPEQLPYTTCSRQFTLTLLVQVC